MISIIILIIGLISGFISLLAARGDLFDKDTPTKRGRILIGCTFVLIFLPMIQKFFEDKVNAKKEKDALVQQDKRDSILQARHDSSLIASVLKMKQNFDSSNQDQTITISTTLGKYGYALDSANKTLVRLIKDSSKTRVMESENPTLSLSVGHNPALEIVQNSPPYYKLAVNVVSYDASSCDYDTKISAVVSDSTITTFDYVFTYIFLENYVSLGKNDAMKQFYEMRHSKPFKFLLLWIRGTYKNGDRTKTYKIDAVYYINSITGGYGIMTNKTRERVVQLVLNNANTKNLEKPN